MTDNIRHNNCYTLSHNGTSTDNKVMKCMSCSHLVSKKTVTVGQRQNSS